MHQSAPVALATSADDGSAPSLGSAVLTVAGRFETMRARIADLEQENTELAQSIGDMRELANTNARAVATRNGRIAELEDQLRAVGQLSAAQGEKLLRIDELARTANESETAMGAERERYAALSHRAKQLVGTIDEVDAAEAAVQAGNAAVEAYKRRNGALVDLLHAAGVLLIPDSLMRCER